MKVLIIGSKGFIGKHAVTHFTKAHEVWECDVVTDYTTANYVQVDATNADYHALFENNQFDVCINCSGAASVPDSIKNPQRDFMLNTVNVFKQLDAIRKHNKNCKYINLSSAAVYGNPKYLPIDEKHPLEPISPYGVHKRMAEDLCQSFYQNFSLKTCSLRIFSAYGAGLQKQLFWDLYQKAQNSTQVELFGSGNESRDFIHVQDVVKAIELVIKQADFEHTIINVASSKELTIKTVAETFYTIYNPNIAISFKGQVRTGDPVNWVANTELLSSFGFQANADLYNGLTSYISWLNDHA